ncbi:hypothetical protein O3M35_004835 [Rhynocoris fuscipes]|uniref:ATP synthase F0 subunit 8 n=1 Tax=Rhynocoris fuscipes TaxID=488301 RepID=A0AAW1DGC5_9HEMI
MFIISKSFLLLLFFFVYIKLICFYFYIIVNFFFLLLFFFFFFFILFFFFDTYSTFFGLYSQMIFWKQLHGPLVTVSRLPRVARPTGWKPLP